MCVCVCVCVTKAKKKKRKKKPAVTHNNMPCCLFMPGPSILWASLVTLMVKNPPATQETWIQSLGRKDPLEKGMATHSGILATERGAWWAAVHAVRKSGTRLSC